MALIKKYISLFMYLPHSYKYLKRIEITEELSYLFIFLPRILLAVVYFVSRFLSVTDNSCMITIFIIV